MSTYNEQTKHPVTGKWENATWYDDYFGNHNYGISFPSDNEGKDYRGEGFIVYDPREHDMETRETTADEKVIETKQHASGRRDVKINVKRLDVNPKDEGDSKAKAHIEDVVFPALAERMVLVVVIHKPTNNHVERIVKAANVRKFAEAVEKSHNDSLVKQTGVKGCEAPRDEFVIVEHELKSGAVRVTTL